jgi:Nif-specific regulatory protein
MNPKLIIIAGPVQSIVFEINEDEISIGRDTSNSVRLVDPSVSRKHSLIKREEERCKIVDLDSFNGTFINGTPILEQYLEHGDQLAIGDVLLLFLMHDGADESEPPHVLFDDEQLVTQSTVQLRKQDAFYLQPEKVMAALPPTARIARDLNVLLKISSVINSIHNSRALQNRLLELILEVIPAERGTILLVAEDQQSLVPSVTWSKGAGKDEQMRVSRTIALQVLREGVAILSNDISVDASLGTVESLIAAQSRALLCVPLVALEKRAGVIYLDTQDRAMLFDEHHLQLLTAIADISAVTMINMQHAELLEHENQRLQKEINIGQQMIGESRGMRELYLLLAKVALSDSSVLIRGESGTGKELTARAIHANSPRAQKSFLAINCATLTETLLESELFGHEKGAFTGAVVQKKGKLEIANGGTLFLDEVGELALNIQAKLLRVLQEREFERVGGTLPVKVDVRVIAATNKNLEEAMRNGSFRQDLYFRLNVISLTTPALRDRREDIPLLANYFVAKYSQKSKRRVVGLSVEARAYLKNYHWPGNVRELENAIERAVVLGTTDRILPEDLPEPVLEAASSASSAPAQQLKYYEEVKEMKRQLLLNTLRQAGGSYTEAAKLLGIHPNNLHRLIRNMDLKSELIK